MRVATITPYSCITKRKTDGNSQYDYYRNRLSVPQQDIFQKTANPSFTAFIATQKEFRALPGRRIIHCIYCNKPLLTVEALKDFQKRGVFSGSIEDFVKEISPYKDKLKPSIKEVFDRMEIYAKNAPQTNLSRVIQVMHSESLAKLRQKQEPIFNEFSTECKKLPKRYKEDIDKFLKIQYCKLMGLPHIAEFSGKEFTYKLERMTQTVPNDRLAALLIQTAAPLKHECFKFKNHEVPDKIFKQIFPKKVVVDPSMPVNNQSMQLVVIEKIKKIGEKLDRQDIINLCRNSEKMLLKKEVIVPFSNKTFKYDMDEILQGLEDRKLYIRLVNIMKKLPTSSTNINSFITKHKYSDSETIGYWMLHPSTTTIEHITPRSLNGADEMGNWALSCPVDNNARQHGSMQKFLEKFDPQNPQLYFDDIVDAVNAGEINLQDAMAMRNSIRKESGLEVNFSHLTNETLVKTFGYSAPQKRFDEFIDLANNDKILSLDVIELQETLKTRCGIRVDTNKMKYFFV